MAAGIDNSYRVEKLLDWERKSLTSKFSNSSFFNKSDWVILGLIILGLSVFGLIVPFIPPRYHWSNWAPAITSEEYWNRLTNFWVTVPTMIFAVFAYINLRNKIDLTLGTKWTANFKVTEVLNLGTIKILLMNGWRPFSFGARQPYFNSVGQGQIISIKRTATFRLIDYYIRNEKKFLEERVGSY